MFTGLPMCLDVHIKVTRFDLNPFSPVTQPARPAHFAISRLYCCNYFLPWYKCSIKCLQELKENDIPLENVRICYSPFSRTTHTAKVVASVLNLSLEGPQGKVMQCKSTPHFLTSCDTIACKLKLKRHRKTRFNYFSMKGVWLAIFFCLKTHMH